MTYRYFGRHGGTANTLAIYRLPSELLTGMFDFKHFEVMELLKYDHTWVKDQNDIAEKDWMHGWFNERDELTEDEVEALYLKWRTITGWPARK